ncbi:hypothetical protein HPB48_022967 [Haemaphysalis longicornis]|uniref:RING-type E3 ubiquitin transferase n=1 Tax=Haemaphysalis longicornis TaxID=44386 RepID=A0A9J6FSK3_HAELO|nr:hypothetical protein HPB48_022967 [Haemaphysalis longicornis]
MVASGAWFIVGVVEACVSDEELRLDRLVELLGGRSLPRRARAAAHARVDAPFPVIPELPIAKPNRASHSFKESRRHPCRRFDIPRLRDEFTQRFMTRPLHCRYRSLTAACTLNVPGARPHGPRPSQNSENEGLPIPNCRRSAKQLPPPRKKDKKNHPTSPKGIDTFHDGVTCNACSRSNFRGKRYKCLNCYHYNLCETCYDAGAHDQFHKLEHAMQCILTAMDYNIYFGGETATQPQSFTCPMCATMGYTLNQLGTHVWSQHSGNDLHVVCPVCAATSGGDPINLRGDLATHLTFDHATS